MDKEKAVKIAKYAGKRLLQILVLLLLISFAVFVLLSFAPGDPALLILGSQATEEKVIEIRESLGLNDPVYVRYFRFLRGLVLHGDLGRSYQSSRPVLGEIKRTLPVSMRLAFNGIVISTIAAIFLGVVSAVRQYSAIDNITKVVVLAGVSMPIFWLGLVMIVVFSVYLRLFPSAGWGDFRHMVLPSVTLAAYPLATLARLTRSTMLEEIRKNYVRTARSKGLAERNVVYKHALRNALIPVVTMSGVQFGLLISGSILTETIFAVPGMGRLTVTAIYTRDYPVIQGTILVGAAILAFVNLIVDISYTFLDPRIEY